MIADLPSPASDPLTGSRFLETLYPRIQQFRRFRDDRERFAARMVGRWRNGTPLIRSPERPLDNLAEENDFFYLPTDPHGYRCPIGAHVRRGNPRDALANADAGLDAAGSLERARRARIIRRGRPYYAEDGSVGLHFICLNANLRDQFEFVQANWINGAAFAGLVDEVDPLIGALPGHLKRTKQSDSREFTIQQAPYPHRVSGLPDFVQVVGGGYFFVPSLNALRFLAEVPFPGLASG
ncbi:MAG: hypothetical protein R3E48_01995 [Burkholderiaceae bacterium]